MPLVKRRTRAVTRRGGLVGFLTGLVSGAVSTAMMFLGGRVVGRDPALDCMQIGTVVLGSRGIRTRPGLREIAAGVLVHLAADALRGALYGAWVARLRPSMARTAWSLGAVPWAVGSSAFERAALQPWIQPVLPMQFPYWAVLSLRLGSSCVYPLGPWIEQQVAPSGQPPSRLSWILPGSLLVVVAGWLVRIRFRGAKPWPGVTADQDACHRRFLRRLVAHHRVGIEMASMASERAERASVCSLARLMVAEHDSQLSIMRGWWGAWYGEAVPPLLPAEHQSMYGMPRHERLTALSELSGTEFERRFLPLMIFHHEGALILVNDLGRTAADPRLRLLARSIRHSQQRQIRRMERLYAGIASGPARARTPHR